jgi:hypothetical protein
MGDFEVTKKNQKAKRKNYNWDLGVHDLRMQKASEPRSSISQLSIRINRLVVGVSRVIAFWYDRYYSHPCLNIVLIHSFSFLLVSFKHVGYPLVLFAINPQTPLCSHHITLFQLWRTQILPPRSLLVHFNPTFKHGLNRGRLYRANFQHEIRYLG